MVKMDQKTAINKVRKQGLEIQNLPEEFKNDELVVLAALENDEYALNFASNELKNNREFIKKVVKKNGRALQFAGESIKADKEIAKIAFKSNWNEYIMRLIKVIKITFLGFLLTNLFITVILFIDSLIDGKNMPWEYLGFVTIYGMIVSIILGYMDRPTLEKRLLTGITICSALVFVTSFLIDNETLSMHSIYVFFGIVVGRKMVFLVDLTLKDKSKN
jgi:hypothetical protein